VAKFYHEFDIQIHNSHSQSVLATITLCKTMPLTGMS